MGLPAPVFDDGQVTLYCGDAMQLVPQLEPASVQLILIDPPYWKTKLDYLGEKLTWDRQWKTKEAYLDWLRALAKEWQRVLAPNGSLYVFASPQLAAWVEVTLSETFHILNHLVWRKHDGSGAGTGGHSKVCKEDLMSYFPQSERILFAEQYGSDTDALGTSGYAAQCSDLHRKVFAPIGRYIQQERERAALTRDQVDVGLGYVRTKNPERGTELCRRWEEGSSLPTKETYERLRVFLNTHGRQEYSYLRQEYEDLRQEYEDLRQEYSYLRQEYEDLRRPFTVTKDVPYTDVFEYKTVPYEPGKHPCSKPVPMLRDLINASSRPNDLILDCFAGSGATLEAARQCGRRALGIELDPAWCAKAASGLKQQWLF
jgi:adenine-specific DNA-methyltransferase